MPATLLEPLERDTLAEQAVRSLKRFIFAEALKAGAQLPSERELTEALGVSRNVVREALRTLVAEGYIEKDPGRGAFLKPFDPQRLKSELDEQLGDLERARDLREIRAALEVGAMPFIIRRITAPELAQLRGLAGRMKELLAAGKSLVKEDRQFHDVLINASHNEGLISLRQAVLRSLRLSNMDTPIALAHSTSHDENTVRTAEQIVASLERRDLETAERAMRTHLIFDLPPAQSRIFLFVDDEEIASMRHLTRTVNQPSKHYGNPVIIPEYDWEGEAVFPSATVLYDAGAAEFRMWYQGYRYLASMEEQYSLCYATSIDGIHWRKPTLGIVEYEGDNENNLLIPWGDARRPDTMSVTIFYNPEAANPDRRYTMIHYCSGMYPLGLGIAFSADGLHWRAAEDNPVDSGGPEPIGDVLYALNEPESNRIAAYYRVRLRVRPRRSLARAVTTDLVHWTGHRVIIEADEEDSPDAEMYGMTPFRYGDLILAFLWVSTENNSRVEIQLACSRDGESWQRVGGRRPFLSPGPQGAFDSRMIVRTSVPVIVGNELWFYYMGAQGPANDRGEMKPGIGLATLTMDRFVSLDAGEDEGEVVTRPLTIADQTTLLLNAVTNPGGAILVELLDPDGNPIAGFTREDAHPFYDSAVFYPVRWMEHADLSALGGQTVQIRFILRRAKLFAFRLCRPDAAVSDLVAGIC